MNREAAALGVPVYSIFKGSIGAVDRYLADKDRLIFLESLEDVKTKLVLKPWQRPENLEKLNNATLQSVVDLIIFLFNKSSDKEVQQ